MRGEWESRRLLSSGTCSATHEVQNEHDDTDDQQNMNQTGADVKRKKAEQPENNQNRGD